MATFDEARKAIQLNGAIVVVHKMFTYVARSDRARSSWRHAEAGTIRPRIDKREPDKRDTEQGTKA
jgi:hypothetical protein